MTTTSTSTRAHLGRVPEWAFVALLALVATLLGWPARGLVPQAGLDPSWILGLSMAGDAGLHVGEDLAFTFGPLGPLSRPIRTDNTLLWMAGMLVRGTAMYAVAWLTAHHTSRLLGRLGAAVATLVLVPLLLVPFGRGADPELLVVFAALLLVRLARAPNLRWWHGGAPLLLGVVLFLAKVSSGFTALGLWGGWLALSLFVRRRDPKVWTLVAWAAAAPLVLFLGGFLTGFSAAGLVAYVHNGVDLAAGFATGMHKTHPAVLTHLFAFTIATVVVALGVVLRLRATRDEAGVADRKAVGRELVAAAVLAAFAFTRLKYGFTREGPGHLLPAVGAMVLLGLATWPTRGPGPGRAPAPQPSTMAWWRRPGWVVPVVGVLGLVLVLRGVADAWIAPSHAGDALADLASLVSSDDSDIHADVLRQYGLVEFAEALQTDAGPDLPAGTIHVDPWDAAIAWALFRPHDWSPPPVFQSYSAYTPHLDRLNAVHLAGPDAPDVVLRQPKMVDGRNPAWDPPRHLLALACNYDLEREIEAQVPDDAPAATRRWDLLLRRPTPRCDALDDPAPVTTLEVALGEWFDRPRPDCGTRLTTFTLGYDGGGAGAALRTLAWLPPEVRVEAELTDGRTASWRWLPAFAGQPMLLDAPNDVRWALRGSSAAIERMRVVRADDLLQPPADAPFEVTATCR